MKVTETTDKGRRKVVATNDGEAPLRFRVEIIDEGLDDWLVSSSLGRARSLRDAAQVLFMVAAAGWRSFRARVPAGHLEGEPTGGRVPADMGAAPSSWTGTPLLTLEVV